MILPLFNRGRLLALFLIIQAVVPGSQAADPVVDPPVTNPLAGLGEALEQARIACGVTGMSVAVVHKGEIIFAQGFGKRNTKDPFTADTLAPIASVTKSFTSAAIGELVAEGKLDWDVTPVSNYLPEFRFKDGALNGQITMDDLLSHRTGFPRSDMAWYRPDASRRDLIKTLKNVNVPPRPRTNFIYNNLMYAVAGEAAAEVSGMSYEKLVETKVLRPLGMNQTGFSTRELKKRKNYAIPFTAANYEEAVKGNFTVLPLDPIPLADAAAGDMFSSANELAIWARAMLHSGALGDKQILNKDSIERIHSPHMALPNFRTQGFQLSTYGMGWMLDTYKGQYMVHHGGNLIGFRSNVATFPDEDLAIIHLTNADKNGLAGMSVFHIADLILNLPKTEDWLMGVAVNNTKRIFKSFEKLAKGTFPEQIPNKPAAHAPKEYIGTFVDAVYGDVSVLERNGSLVFKMRTLESVLDHLHYETFKVSMKDVQFAVAGMVHFHTAATGGVDSLTMELQYGEEPVIFKRKV